MRAKPARQFPDMPNLDIVARDEWVLEGDYIGPVIDGKSTVVKAGITTDGGSIPMVGRAVVGSKVRYPNIALYVLHDAEYLAELYPRKECDRRLKIGLRMAGVSWWHTTLIYNAVRLCGGFVAWNKHDQKEVANYRQSVFSVSA